MKRALFLFSVLVLSLLITALSVQADAPVVIRPYRLADNEVVTVSTDDDVIITARWVTCKRGLTEAFRHAAMISLDERFAGETTTRVNLPGRGYWEAVTTYELPNPENCLLPTKTGWATYWNYDLGTLAEGQHLMHFTWNLAHPLPDGGDYDGDGKLDFFSSDNWGHDNYFVLEVVAP